jgi:hypothetical protein
MADLNKVFGLIRVVILVLVSLFSALVLIMGALVTDFSMNVLRGYFVYAAFAIAIAALTLLTVPAMLALSINRKGAFPSMIVVELSYVALLWVLWLSVGGTIGTMPMINYCSTIGYYAGYYYSGYESACMETQAMAAFAFLNWIMLMFLNIFLLTLAIIQANRGHSIWTSCVTDVDYSAPGVASGMPESKIGYGSPVTPTAQYPQPVPTPPQGYPQQAYPPQQYPQQAYSPQPQQGMPMAGQV